MALNRSQTGGVSHLNPSQATTRVDSQQIITVQAANKYGLSPQTLWGIYGTETTFGANTSDSSAGAQGPMQFEPATWHKYGGGRNVRSFDAAMPAAAHYLHDLGADGNPTSAATIAAVNAYNGNGGGSNASTTYFQSVLKLGSQLSVSGVNATTPSTTNTTGGSGGNLGSPLEILTDIVTGNISDLAATLAMAVAVGVKDAAVGFGDLVVVPLWHRNQEAIWYYYENCLLPGKGATHPAWQTLPINAAFWGFGYALLFTDPESDSPLKIASPRKSRIARHVRRLQSVPARQALTKPSEVAARTAKKPKVQSSKVRVSHLGTLNTTRNRPVTVTGTLGGSNRVTGTGPGPNQPGTASSEAIRQVGSLTQSQAQQATGAQPHAGNSNGRNAHPDSGSNSQGRPAARPEFRRRRNPRT